MLPALAGRLPRWLEGDASAARIQGIVKMVWSRNQVRLHKAAEVHEALHRASVAPVAITGPLACSLLTREQGAIRSIPDLTMLIPRRHVSNAVSALARDGWELRGELPQGEALDWSYWVPLTKREETLRLYWRLFPAPADELVACERAFMERPRTIVWNQHAFSALSPEADLLHRLTDRPSWDPVPWQADVLMMPFAGVNWTRLRELAIRFESVFEPVDVVGRMMQLRRDWQLPIPEMAPARRRPLSAMAGALFRRFPGGRLPWRS